MYKNDTTTIILLRDHHEHHSSSKFLDDFSFDTVNFVLMLLHNIISFPELLIADIAVLTGMDLLYVFLKTGLTEKLFITVLTRSHMNILKVFLQLG